MPVTTPPVGGPLGRSRRRLSGSAYSTWRRCPTEWRITRGLGLGSPTSPSQVLGHVLEDGVIRLIMRHAPAGADRVTLLAWLTACAQEEAHLVREEGLRRWDALPWRREWETPGWPFTVEDLTSRLMSAVDLMMVEVDRCIEVGGGPYLDAMRTGERIFEVPAPCDGARPEHPLPTAGLLISMKHPRPRSQAGRSPVLPSTTPKRGRSCGLGSRTRESGNLSACSILKVGRPGNSTSCCGGTEPPVSSTSSRVTVVAPTALPPRSDALLRLALGGLLWVGT